MFRTGGEPTPPLLRGGDPGRADRWQLERSPSGIELNPY